jgi:hypothetical protein
MASRFHLFSYYTYYPAGGMGDYCGTFDSPEEAADYIRSGEYRDSWHMAQVNERGELAETEHYWMDNERGWYTAGEG